MRVDVDTFIQHSVYVCCRGLMDFVTATLPGALDTTPWLPVCFTTRESGTFLEWNWHASQSIRTRLLSSVTHFVPRSWQQWDVTSAHLGPNSKVCLQFCMQNESDTWQPDNGYFVSQPQTIGHTLPNLHKGRLKAAKPLTAVPRRRQWYDQAPCFT